MASDGPEQVKQEAGREVMTKYLNEWLGGGIYTRQPATGLTEQDRSIITTPVACPPQTYENAQYKVSAAASTSAFQIQYDVSNWYSTAMASQQAFATVNQNWYTLMSGLGSLGSAGLGSLTQPPETPEEKATREEREAKRKAASLRAEHLLFTILTPSQVRQYTDDEYFDVVIDQRTYRIRKGYSRNVELIEAGKPTALYCAHPANAYSMPVPDTMLAQLLALKTNEAEFLKTANKTVLH
jgi:hypothetical protein